MQRIERKNTEQGIQFDCEADSELWFRVQFCSVLLTKLYQFYLFLCIMFIITISVSFLFKNTYKTTEFNFMPSSGKSHGKM